MEEIRQEAIDALRRELVTTDAAFQSRHRFPKPKHDQAIVFYSSVGMRSDVATKIALEIGYKNVRSLYGGSRLWNKFFNALPLDVNALLPPVAAQPNETSKQAPSTQQGTQNAA